MKINDNKTYTLNHDIKRDDYTAALKAKIVGIDIETTGLSWKEDKICTCQIYIPGKGVLITKIDNKKPRYISALIESSRIKKVFHYALFDLRFMCFKWKLVPSNIQCTKIASKLLDPENKEKHTLQYLLRRHMNIRINKKERLSDWTRFNLLKSQISYARNDVVHLIPLLKKLELKLKRKYLYNIMKSCFEYIPTKVQLDIYGYVEVYNY